MIQSIIYQKIQVVKNKIENINPWHKVVKKEVMKELIQHLDFWLKTTYKQNNLKQKNNHDIKTNYFDNREHGERQ